MTYTTYRTYAAYIVGSLSGGRPCCLDPWRWLMAFEVVERFSASFADVDGFTRS